MLLPAVLVASLTFLRRQLVDDAFVEEVNVPQRQTLRRGEKEQASNFCAHHIALEAEVHAPAHPRDVSLFFIDAEAMTSKGYGAGTGSVVKVPRGTLPHARRPRWVDLWIAHDLKRPVIERLDELFR